MSTPTGPERRVRDALHDTVDDLEPVSGLSALRSRLQEDAVDRPRRSRPVLLTLGGAAAVAVVVTGVVLATQDTDPAGHSAPPAASTTPDAPGSPSPADSPSPSDPASPTDSAAPTSTRVLPVYYVGDAPTGPRLYREFHRVEVSGEDVLGAALRQAVGTPPLDPDYRSPWPGGTRLVSAASSSNDQRVAVDLSGPATGSLRDRPAGMSREEAEMAVQQLVYTAQAAVQDRVPVQLLLDGRPADRLLGVPTAEPLANGDPMSTLATVWVTSPQDGDTVRAGRVKVTGVGAFFEANVVWQLRQRGRVVDTGSGTAQECCTLSPYELVIPDVKPGEYVLRVFDQDMSGGEGPGEAEDTKRITVE